MEKKWEIFYEIDENSMKEAIALDKETFEEIDTVNIERCKSWIKRNNQIYTILKCNGELVGYANFTPLTEECYQRYRAGEGKDYFLQSSDIVPFKKNKSNKCLMLSIVIKKEYRDGEAIRILSSALAKRISDFENHGIHISHVVQDCVSIDGIKFALNFFGAKYVCDSIGGKIYEANLEEERKIFPLKLRYEEINENNVKVIGRIQYEIFKDANGVGYCDYLEEVNKEKSQNRLPINFLVYYNENPVGVVGLYEIEGYKDDIWMNWLGVLPQYRRKGIGSEMLFHVMGLAREYGKKNFRLFSYENWHKSAISIYKKTMQIQESYLNKDDDLRLIIEGGCKIFSSSLVDKKPPLWNSKFIGLVNEEELHKRSVKALIDDGIIEACEVKEKVAI